jgi:polyhydroxybutyrate depolymerase
MMLKISNKNIWLHKFAVRAICAAALMLITAGCGDKTHLQPAVYNYPAGNNTACAANERPGAAGIVDGEKTPAGIGYSVRTPANYDARIAHALLMVYAPAGLGARSTERQVMLTNSATAAGFIVAYADHRPGSPTTVKDLAAIPKLIAQKWCVDEKRIAATGHSDGGTVALALSVLPETRQLPAGIAPSAAGFTKQDLDAYSCPDPLPVMILHSADDSLFPGFGAQTAAWWAACNRCDANPTPQADGACVSYANCANGVQTLYCEGKGHHARWPKRNEKLIEFFKTAKR